MVLAPFKQTRLVVMMNEHTGSMVDIVTVLAIEYNIHTINLLLLYRQSTFGKERNNKLENNPKMYELIRKCYFIKNYFLAG